MDALRNLGIPAAMQDAFEPVQVVWEEHWPALELMSALGTQWRVGMAGATGLDYAAVPAVMDLLQIPESDRRERFDELRLMEREALQVMSERRK